MSESSETPGVKQFFKDSSVLVTGATGFLGKVIIEKMLRACPEVQNIYILIRQKKGFADTKQRLKHILEDPLFDKVKKECPTALQKLVSISGDIGMPCLSISPTDRTLLTSNVSVVIHAAATVKFNESLDTAMELNVNGLRRVLELCREMTHFKSLVYISTAYSNCDQITIEEKVYPPPVGADEILNHFSQHTPTAVTSDDNVDFSHFVKKSRPNTYSYTKALAEHVLEREAHGLPVCIVRPSIVTATWREPVAGWVDNVNNVTGILAGLGLGALRVMMMDPLKAANMVPVDVVANLTLCAAWDTAVNRKPSNGMGLKNSEPIKIYNCCVPKGSTINNMELTENVLDNVRRIGPISNAIWYPNLHLTTSKLCYRVKNFLFQFLPAIVFDMCSFGNKRIGAFKAYKKLTYATILLEYFTMNEWNFCTKNVTNLRKLLNSEDNRTFYFNLENVDWTTYMRSYWSGMRKYILKENESTLDKAQTRMTRIYWIHTLLKLARRIIATWGFYKVGYKIFLKMRRKIA